MCARLWAFVCIFAGLSSCFLMSFVFSCDYWIEPSVTHFYPSFYIHSLFRFFYVFVLISLGFFSTPSSSFVFFVVNLIVSDYVHVISLVYSCSSFHVRNWKKFYEKRIWNMRALKSTRIAFKYFVDFATRTSCQTISCIL